jgi:hypothetical protein
MLNSRTALNQPTAQMKPIPAPTKGWNRRDPLSQMKKGFAVTLDNWFPLPYSIQLRAGSRDYTLLLNRYEDPFTDSDGDLGAPYVTMSELDAGADPLEIVSNTLGVGANELGASRLYLPDQDIKVGGTYVAARFTVADVPAAGSVIWTAYLRYNPDDVSYYAMTLQRIAGVPTASITRVMAGGASTALVTESITFPVATDVVEFVANGSSLSILIEGAEVAEATDTQIASGDWLGLSIDNTGNGSIESAWDLLEIDGIREEEVSTLITYRPKSGVQELWAFSDDDLFDASAGGVNVTPEETGLQSDEWNCVNFSTTGGNYVIALNGLDEMLLYDGTTWESIDGTSVPIAITNVDTDDLINLFIHKERPYYIEKASMVVWYPAVGTIGGALTDLDLSSVFGKGGSLVAGGSWSIDAGDGKDDFACFITSEGELAVYQGSNPADAAAWSLVGVFEIGAPIGWRCMRKYGGDLMIQTVDGIISASAAFQRGRDDAKQLAITDVIQGAVAESGSLYKAAYGWHMTLFSEASMLLVNVPESTGVKQWAMNTVTKAWGRFLGWETTCFEIFNGALYFGGVGAVVRAWTGKNDNGTKIVAEVVPAFSYFDSPGSSKQWTMLQANIEWDANPLAIKVGFDVDFRTQPPTQQIALGSSSGGSNWNEGEWNGAVWSGSATVQSEWYVVDGLGIAGAPHMIFESLVSTARITSFNVMQMPGSVF